MSCTFKSLTIAAAMFAATPAAAVFLAPAASAETPIHAQLTVVYGDLDLTKEAGVRALMSRLDKVSSKVCGGRPATDSHGQLTRFRTCRVTAIADAVRRIDQPAVTFAWQGKAGSVSVASR